MTAFSAFLPLQTVLTAHSQHETHKLVFTQCVNILIHTYMYISTNFTLVYASFALLYYYSLWLRMGTVMSLFNCLF